MIAVSDSDSFCVSPVAESLAVFDPKKKLQRTLASAEGLERRSKLAVAGGREGQGVLLPPPPMGTLVIGC